MTPKRVPADLVAVRDGAKQDFFKRHRKDPHRAGAVWAALVAKGPLLKDDTAFGPIFTPSRLPPWLRRVWPLRVIKGLPHAFRAVYTVLHDPRDGVVVRIEWVGGHDEYDAAFGYDG